MESSLRSDQSIETTVSNVGGIDEASVTVPPGVSILTGRNATNRTSFLRALMAGFGSERCSLKGDAESGSVTVELSGKPYTRTLTREDTQVVFGGEPYLDDPEPADLFAFLLEHNDARQAVARGDDLRALIMRPIDTEALSAEITACKRDRDEVEAELERLDTLSRDLPELERTRTQTREEYETITAELTAARERLDQHEMDVEQSRSQKQALEQAFEDVREARSTLEDIEFDIETERETIEELRTERDQLETTRAESDVPDARTEEITGRITELRERQRDLTTQITALGDVIEFNQDVREDDGLDVTVDADSSAEDAELTDALQADTAVTCWTCGSTVDPPQIDAMINTLRSLRSDMLDTRSSVQQQISDLTDERERIEREKNTYEQAERELTTTTEQIDAAEARLADLRDRRDGHAETVAELEAAADTIDVGTHETVLEHHRAVADLELQHEQLESELTEITDTIESYETALQTRDELAAQQDEITAQLEQLRTRVERIEADAIAAFNEHMETLLDLLAYENLARIWIERREVSVREGRRTVTKGQFDLHVIRSDEGGAAYEDTVAHLSESEREVTGLVFALAGYLVHEVYAEVPVMCLDSLEAIDAQRIARLIDYLHDYVPHLVVALLPEDADALADSHTYITTID